MKNIFPKNARTKRRMIIYGTIILLLVFINHQYPKSYAVGLIKAQFTDYAGIYQVEEGDFVFQHMLGHLTKMVAEVTDSPYSHCGIVIKKNGEYYVLEAMGTVKETPFDLWVAQGLGQKITIVRLKKDLRSDMPEIIKEAYAFFNRPYDIQYKWDDKNIYCSELIYKAVQNATGVSMAEFVPLGDMNWKPHEKFIRIISGGDIPLERKVITPDSLVRSDTVEIVYSSLESTKSIKNLKRNL